MVPVTVQEVVDVEVDGADVVYFLGPLGGIPTHGTKKFERVEEDSTRQRDQVRARVDLVALYRAGWIKLLNARGF